jgi:SHS2 domain-containing protein
VYPIITSISTILTKYIDTPSEASFSSWEGFSDNIEAEEVQEAQEVAQEVAQEELDQILEEQLDTEMFNTWRENQEYERIYREDQDQDQVHVQVQVQECRYPVRRRQATRKALEG